MVVDNVQWEIKYPFIVAFCPNCRTSFTIEWVTLAAGIKHCGSFRTRLPEKVYEAWLEVREHSKKVDEKIKAAAAVRFI